jgi:hypothetical protein
MSSSTDAIIWLQEWSNFNAFGDNVKMASMTIEYEENLHRQQSSFYFVEKL